MLDADPEDATASRNLSAALLASGHPEAAAAQSRKTREAELRKAVEDHPGESTPHNELGVLLLDRDRPEDALAEFQKAIDLDPGSAAAHVNLGRALTQKGESERALAELERAIQLQPGYAPAHYYLGILLAKQGKTVGALGQFRQAVKCDPADPQAQEALAGTLYAQGETAEALAHWRAAIDLAPTDAVALRQAAWILATSSQPSLRNGQEALALAVRAAEVTGTGTPPFWIPWLPPTPKRDASRTLCSPPVGRWPWPMRSSLNPSKAESLATRWGPLSVIVDRTSSAARGWPLPVPIPPGRGWTAPE